MMSKSEIHIIKDEISMVVEAKGSLFAKAKEQISIMEANVRSGKISETVALALLNAYLNKRLKKIDEFLDEENKRGVSKDGD